MFRQRVTIPAHVLVRELEGESVILNLEDEQYIGLDRIGTRFWQALAASPTVGEAFTALLDEYEVEPARLESDISAFVDGLLHRNLIELVG